jgi:hypothetical protein
MSSDEKNSPGKVRQSGHASAAAAIGSGDWDSNVIGERRLEMPAIESQPMVSVLPVQQYNQFWAA